MQPANTWSSLAFVVVAIIVIARWLKARHIASQPAYPILLAMTLLVVGFGSAFFHSTLSFRGQFVDVLGMYLIATFALLYGIDRLAGLGNRRLIGAYVATNTILAAILYWMPVLRRAVFGLLMIAVIGVEAAIARRGQQRSTAKLKIAIALLGIGFAVWMIDYTRILCRPESWMQGHAVWHVLGALAAWYLYLYYRDQATDAT